MENFLGVLAIIWSILCLILFFKIWGMTNDISEIKYFLLNKDVDVAINDKETKTKMLKIPDTFLKVGDIVTEKKTGKKWVVKEVLPNGNYQCEVYNNK